MVEAMLHRTVGGGREEITRSPIDALADRELEVFRLIGQGLKTAEIAEKLHLSVKTIDSEIRLRSIRSSRATGGPTILPAAAVGLAEEVEGQDAP